MSITTDSTKEVSKIPCSIRSASLQQTTNKTKITVPKILSSKHRTENSCWLGKYFLKKKKHPKQPIRKMTIESVIASQGECW